MSEFESKLIAESKSFLEEEFSEAKVNERIAGQEKSSVQTDNYRDQQNYIDSEGHQFTIGQFEDTSVPQKNLSRKINAALSFLLLNPLSSTKLSIENNNTDLNHFRFTPGSYFHQFFDVEGKTPQRNDRENRPNMETEFTFLEESIGSGLDEDGFPKTYELNETGEIHDIIDLRNWEGYKIESVEQINPQYYTPEDVVKGFNGSCLWVIPKHSGDMQFDYEESILQYDLYPEILNSVKIDALYKVVTPEGNQIVLGSVLNDHREKNVNFNVFTLVSFINSDGREVIFNKVSDDQRKVNTTKERFRNELTDMERDTFLKIYPQFVIERIFADGVDDFEELKSRYKPSFYRTGVELSMTDSYEFLQVMDTKSIENQFSEEYLEENKALSNLLQLSKYIYSLKKARESIDDKSDLRSFYYETDKDRLLFKLWLDYPQLNIPYPAYGSYRGENADTVSSFYKEIIDLIEDENFKGIQRIKIPHRDYIDEVSFNNLAFKEDQYVELYSSQLNLDELMVGDVILLPQINEKNNFEEINYMVVVGKEKREDGNTVIAVVQADRYEREFLSVYAVDDENASDILSISNKDLLYWIRTSN